MTQVAQLQYREYMRLSSESMGLSPEELEFLASINQQLEEEN